VAATSYRDNAQTGPAATSNTGPFPGDVEPSHVGDKLCPCSTGSDVVSMKTRAILATAILLNAVCHSLHGFNVEIDVLHAWQ